MSTAATRRPEVPVTTTRVRVSAGDELDVWARGAGEPVILVHGALTRDALVPLAGELVRCGYRTIHYGRRGHGGVGLPAQPGGIPEQAWDIITILDALGLDRAHVVGHSFGGIIALDLATQVPERLRSVVLLEAPLVQTAAMQESLPDFERAMSLVVAAHTDGHHDAAVERFWDFTSGIDGSAEVIVPSLPRGARGLAAMDLDTWLQVDLPAMSSWMADPAAVRGLTTPVVWVGAADSPPLFHESRVLIKEWLPSVTAVEIPGVGHYFPVLRPRETAAALARTLSRL